MSWVSVQAGSDHLGQYTRKSPIDALAELIWNSLDAEATWIEIELETDSLVPDGAEHVTRITVSDNGHGISQEIAHRAFPSLGDSWKRSLNGRSVNDLRALHGSLGRGRFYVYSLGHRATWRTTSKTDKDFFSLQIAGSRTKITGFDIGPTEASNGPTGTVVTVTAGEDQSLQALLRDDLPVQLAAILAPHLLGNPDIRIRVNGAIVDPLPLMESDASEIPLDNISPADLDGRETPLLRIVDWTDAMRSAPGLLLCREDGASLIEIPKSSPKGSVKSTGYLCWSAWADTGADLIVSQTQFPSVVDEGLARLTEHVRARTEVLRASIVETLKRENSYPYPETSSSPIQNAERQVFDLLAVAARRPLLKHGNQQVRSMTARLLQIALQERPESLDQILEKALNLTDKEREEFADILKVSSLGSIISAAAEVTRRLDLLLSLRHLIYDPSVSKQMREVDQLHPLVRNNAWLFGESWRLTASEAGLTTILRSILPQDKLLEIDLSRRGIEEHLRGRVDLMLQRTLEVADDQKRRMVVELKRPSVALGDAEIAQVRKYARALTQAPGTGDSKWTFWLVGSDTKDEIRGELEQADREWGNVNKSSQYEIWVTTWGRLLNNAETRLNFYRQQLEYNASQEEALRRVRSLHSELLPPKKPETEAN
jgi:hypothetical protein